MHGVYTRNPRGRRYLEVYRSVLDDALAELRHRIESMPQGTLLSLLDASFPCRGERAPNQQNTASPPPQTNNNQTQKLQLFVGNKTPT